MARLISATRHLTSATTGEAREAFDCIRRSLENSKHVNYSDRLNKSSLLDAFRRLERDEVLILHVGEQNAGLLIRRHVTERIPTFSFANPFASGMTTQP